MTPEITPQFRMQVFGLYLNTEVKSLRSDKIYNVYGLDYTTGMVLCNRLDKGNIYLYPKDIQLILTPFSEISDEDAIEVAKIIHKRQVFQSFTIDRESEKGIVVHLIPESGFTYEKVFIGNDGLIDFDNMPSFIVDYFRSKNCALPYMGIDLIEAGIAILKP